MMRHHSDHAVALDRMLERNARLIVALRSVVALLHKAGPTHEHPYGPWSKCSHALCVRARLAIETPSP